MSRETDRRTVLGEVTDPPQTLYFHDDGRTPNSRLPVLVYRGAPPGDGPLGDALERLFRAHDWPPQWRGGVFDYHHYHSVAHETLGVAVGEARLMLGGEAGDEVHVARGDVLVLPAGTGHCRLDASADFELVAAYPPDQQDWDLCRPGDADHARAAARIASLAMPASDPVHGTDGGLVDLWH